MITPVVGTSPEVIETIIQYVQSNPGVVLGPWLMALVSLTFMLGILTIQTWQYFSVFGFESLGIFTIVTTSVVLSLVQWLLLEMVGWNYFVAHYGDWRTVVEVSWPVWFQPIIAQLTIFSAQLFFAFRCFSLYGRNKVIFGGLILAMLGGLAMFTMAGITLMVDPYNFQLHSQFTIPALCINLATDLIITTLTLWKLSSRGGSVFSPNIGHVLRRLRNVVMEAAIPPTICASLNMAFFLALGRKNIIFTWFNIMTPRFYVCSLMLTLNARVKIRNALNSPNGDDGSSVDTSFEFCNVAITGPYAKSQHTNTHRTTIVVCPTGTSVAPHASMGVVDERVGGDGDPLGGRLSKAESSIAGTSRSNLQIDLDRWESASTIPNASVTSLRQRRNSEPPTPSSRLDFDSSS